MLFFFFRFFIMRLKLIVIRKYMNLMKVMFHLPRKGDETLEKYFEEK